MDIEQVTTAFSIDAATGNIWIGHAIVLEAGQPKALSDAWVDGFLTLAQDYGNGYEWLNLGGLNFGGQPASLALCFFEGRFDQAAWSVQLPDAALENGWPTKEGIDEEVRFVRSTLANDMGLIVGMTPWVEVWSMFDAKAFVASNGLRYRRT